MENTQKLIHRTDVVWVFVLIFGLGLIFFSVMLPTEQDHARANYEARMRVACEYKCDPFISNGYSESRGRCECGTARAYK